MGGRLRTRREGHAAWLAIVLIVLGSIFGGLMTPNEASGLGAVLSLAIAWHYGTLSYGMV